MGGRYVISATGSGVDHLIAAPVAESYPSIVSTVAASQSSGRGTAGFGVTCQGTASSSPGSGSSGAPASAVSPSPVSPSPGGASAATTPAATSTAGLEPHLMYEFLVLSNGSWVVERRDGSPSKALPPVVLAHGPSPAVPGTAVVSVSGVCASAANGKAVRLILFVDAVRLADITDARSSQDGWRPGLVVTTIDVAAVVSVRHFEERQLP